MSLVFDMGHSENNSVTNNYIEFITDNKAERIFQIDSQKEIDRAVNLINTIAKRPPKSPAINSFVKNELVQFVKRLFLYQLENGGITIKLDVKNGDIYGYYSFSYATPSSVLNDGKFKREIFIPPLNSISKRMKRSPTFESVFVTTEGLQQTNEYTIVGEFGDITKSAGNVIFKFNKSSYIFILVFLQIAFNL